MAKLSSKARAKLPAKNFALPGRKFPIEDKAHAVAAERLVGRAEKAGSITPAQAAEVKSKARAKLAKGADAPAKAKLAAGGSSSKAALDDKNGTHDRHGLTYDDSMKAFHHDGPKHDSDDR